eukprot:871666-Amphidinium_carterae.2
MHSMVSAVHSRLLAAYQEQVSFAMNSPSASCWRWLLRTHRLLHARLSSTAQSCVGRPWAGAPAAFSCSHIALCPDTLGKIHTHTKSTAQTLEAKQSKLWQIWTVSSNNNML